MLRQPGKSEGGADEAPPALTTFHVRRARVGDGESIAWIVERFSPLLRVAAEQRLGKVLRSIYEPDDLVQEVWLVALPKVAEISARGERYTPVLLKFLSTTLRNKVRRLVEKHIQGKPKKAEGKAGDQADPLADLPAPVTTVLRRLGRNETRDQVAESLSRLDERDREILVLRGIEQQPYKAIAAVLHADPAALAVRYQRALERLRRELPGSIYDELGD